MARDVLHFTHNEQWVAWEKLLKSENQPDVDDYLQSLTPPGMIYISAGTFLMGSGDDDPDAEANEKPQHQAWLRGFYIDRFTVTNVEYRKFIESEGYHRREFWTEAGWKEKIRYDWESPRFWNDQHFNQEDQPVVGASWYEAVAYARWAGKTLPTEAQWEKAATWDPLAKIKRIYPWGAQWDQQRCHSYGTDCAASIGQHLPEGDSTFGVADMGGNVYEWCSTAWDNEAGERFLYPYFADDGRENLEMNARRIVRGARWGSALASAKKNGRGTSRTENEPGYWVEYRGFRCVVSGKPENFES